MPSALLTLFATSVNRGEQHQEEHGKGNALTISAPTALVRRRFDPSILEADAIVVVDKSEEEDEQISQSSSVGGDVIVTAADESMPAAVVPPAKIQALLEDDHASYHHITSSPSAKAASPTISQLYNIVECISSVECISERASVGDGETGVYQLIKSDASTTAAFTVSAPPALISRHRQQQQQRCDDGKEELSTWSWKKHVEIDNLDHSGAYEALLNVPVSVASQLDPSSLPSANSLAKWFHHRTTLLKLSELMEDQVILTDPSNMVGGGEGEVGGIARRTLTTSTTATTSSSTYHPSNDGIVLPSTTRISCPASFDEEDYRVSFDDGVAHCLFHHPIRRSSSSASSSSPRVADPLLFTDPDAPPMVLVREDEDDEEEEDVGSNASYLHIDDDDEGEGVRVCSHHHAHTLGDVCNPPSAAARLLTPPPSSCPASPTEARLPLAVQLRDTSSTSPPSTPPFSPFGQMYPPVEECSPALHVDPYHPHHQHRTQSSFVNITPRQRRMSKSAGCASCSSSSGRCVGMVPPAALIPRGATDQMEDSIPLFESQMDDGVVGWDGWSLGGGGILVPSAQHHHNNNNNNSRETVATTSVHSTSLLDHDDVADGVVPTSPRMGRRETRPMSHYVDHPLLLNDEDLTHRRATSPRRGEECGTSPDHASFPLTSIIHHHHHHPRPNNNNGHPSSSRRHRGSCCATSIGHCILENSLTSFSTDGAATNTNSVSFGRFSHQDDHHQHHHSHQQQPRRSLGAISALSASHTPTAAGNTRSRYSSPSNAAAVTPVVSVQWLHW